MVRVVAVTTGFAEELVLARSIPLLAVTAHIARPGRVAGVYRDERDAGQPRLIGEAVPQVVERPVGQSGALPAANRKPVADVGQFLNCHPAAGVFGFGNDRLRDAVVLLLLVTGLFAGECLQSSLGGLGALPLERLTGGGVLLPQSLDVFASVPLAVRVGGDIGDAKVNAQEGFHLGGRWLGHVGSAIEEELTVAVDEVGLAFHRVQSAGEVFADKVGDDDSTTHREQTHPVDALEAERPLVVGDGPERLEDGTLGLVAGKALDRLADGPHRRLGRHVETGPQVVVAQLVDRRLGEYAGLERHPCRFRGGGVKRGHVREQGFGLFRVRQQLDLNDELHGGSLGY